MNSQDVLQAMIRLMVISSVLVLVAALLCRCCFTRSAAWRHHVWGSVLWSLVLLPLLVIVEPQVPGYWIPNWMQGSGEVARSASKMLSETMPSSWTAMPARHETLTLPLAPEPRNASDTIEIDDLLLPTDSEIQWQGIDWMSASLVLIWGVGSLWMLLRFGMGRWRLGMLVKRAHPCRGHIVCDALRQVVARDKLNVMPTLLVSSEVATPMVIGFRRFHLILPKAFMESMDRASLDQVLTARLISANFERPNDPNLVPLRFHQAA